MNTLVRIFLIVSLGITQLTGFAKPVVIKQETANYSIDIRYPQGFASNEMNKSIQELINSIRKEQADPKKTNPDLPRDLPGKNGLYINYQTVFQTKHAMSIQFNISSFTKGAAHPTNSVRTINFVNGKKVVLEQLFKSDSNYLAKISSYCRTQLLAKPEADEKWVLTGTAPTQDNYKNWIFNKNGISVIFEPYQVAAYVYGSQTVNIKSSQLNDLLEADFKKIIWGN